MGLPKGMKKALKTTIFLYRKTAQKRDTFGNILSSAPETVMCVLDQTTASFGVETPGSTQETTPSETTLVYTDAIDIRLDDSITFTVLSAGVAVSDGVKRKVKSVVTFRNAKGIPLFQETTVETL